MRLPLIWSPPVSECFSCHTTDLVSGGRLPQVLWPPAALPVVPFFFFFFLGQASPCPSARQAERLWKVAELTREWQRGHQPGSLWACRWTMPLRPVPGPTSYMVSTSPAKPGRWWRLTSKLAPLPWFKLLTRAKTKSHAQAPAVIASVLGHAAQHHTSQLSASNKRVYFWGYLS